MRTASLRATAALAAAALLYATSAAATPLCRDLKGLYTPCAGGPAARAWRAPAARAVDTKKADAGARPQAVTPAPLCRDLKGLFTPCLR